MTTPAISAHKAPALIHRRTFLRAGVVATAAVSVVPRHVLGAPGAASPNGKLNIAGVGVGGMGGNNLAACAEENIVALCDVDSNLAAGTFKKFPGAKTYTDFRVMLDRQKDIDAVIVATPDHTHAVVALAAIRQGKHVYVQKPLAHSIKEARVMTEAARQHKVVTQMGNQGHSGDGARLVCEWIRGGRDRARSRGAHLDQPAGLAAEHRGGAAQRHARRCRRSLNWDSVAGSRALSSLSPGVSSAQVARLVGVWDRLAGRPGLPYHRSGLLGAEAEIPGQRGGLHLDLLGRVLEEDRPEERAVPALDHRPLQIPGA